MFLTFFLLFILINTCIVLLLNDVQTSIYQNLLKYNKRLNVRIDILKEDLENVKRKSGKDTVHEILNTIQDYEAIKTLEYKKEKAIKSKEDKEFKNITNDEINQRLLLKDLGKNTCSKNPVLSINIKEENDKKRHKHLKKLLDVTIE